MAVPVVVAVAVAVAEATRPWLPLPLLAVSRRSYVLSMMKRSSILLSVLLSAAVLAPQGVHAFDLGGLAGKAGLAPGTSRVTKPSKSQRAALRRGPEESVQLQERQRRIGAGCDAKLRNLAAALVKVKQNLRFPGSPATSSRFPVTPTRAAPPSTTRCFRASAPPLSTAS